MNSTTIGAPVKSVGSVKSVGALVKSVGALVKSVRAPVKSVGTSVETVAEAVGAAVKHGNKFKRYDPGCIVAVGIMREIMPMEIQS